MSRPVEVRYEWRRNAGMDTPVRLDLADNERIIAVAHRGDGVFLYIERTLDVRDES